MTFDPSAVARIAGEYSVPPAILQAVLQQQGLTGETGVPESVLATYGMQASDVKGDQNLQLELAARTLQQQFMQYGTWEKTLSVYISGDPNAYTSPTSSVGGFVYSVLGSAAANPTMGMDGFVPSSPNAFSQMASDFGNHMQELTSMGGIISPGHTHAWAQAAASGIKRGQTSIARGAIEIGQGENFTGPAPGAFAQYKGDNFPWGQCTWFAAGAAGSWLTNTQGFGDAHNWIAAAQRNGYQTAQQPTLGAVVVYAAGGGYDADAGHVGVVTGVNQDGTFQVTSDHWDGLGNTHIGTSTMSDVSGFILPPSDDEAKSTVERALKMSGADPSSFAAQLNALTSGGKSAQVAQKTAPPNAAQIKQIQDSQPPKPGSVSEFAQQLQQANIDPDHFAANFPRLASMYRKYTGGAPTIADYAPVAHMSPSEMIEHVLNQPHPTYMEHTIGTIAKWFDTAMLHSIPYAQRTPNLGEAAKFASAQPKWNEMAQFYQALGPHKQQQQQGPPQPDHQQPQPPQQQQMSAGKQRQLERMQ